MSPEGPGGVRKAPWAGWKGLKLKEDGRKGQREQEVLAGLCVYVSVCVGGMGQELPGEEVLEALSWATALLPVCDSV